ncbi:phosphatidate cytidylyltransferase [Persicobacter psychrovividus]|uniref:phosphatidate cytidylyltransferase n=1 Tax=Persicobacter psychrovividus TaxID=387638 RepID=UPI002FCE2478
MTKLSNLTQRVITGLIGIAVFIGAIFYGTYSYFALFFIIAILAQLEFYKLIKADKLRPIQWIGLLLGGGINLITYMHFEQQWPLGSYLLLMPLVGLIYFTKLYQTPENRPFNSIAQTFMGIVYVALPFSLLHVCTFSGGAYNPQIIMGMLLLLWASDSGAYFTGVKFGKHKLFERISPKKTWEGFFGGAALSILVSVVLSHFWTTLPLYEWLGLSVIIIVAGSYGDLVESLFKRSIAIKDSASTLPGHGGFLDRFDGLLLSIPFLVAFFELVRIFVK